MLTSVEAERARKGLSKEDVAKMLGVSARTYHNWIMEKTDVPSSALIKMSNFFGVRIDYLLKDSKGVKKCPNKAV